MLHVDSYCAIFSLLSMACYVICFISLHESNENPTPIHIAAGHYKKTNYENNGYIYLNVDQYSSSFHRKSSFVG